MPHGVSGKNVSPKKSSQTVCIDSYTGGKYSLKKEELPWNTSLHIVSVMFLLKGNLLSEHTSLTCPD
jgi:hypothetical protein